MTKHGGSGGGGDDGRIHTTFMWRLMMISAQALRASVTHWWCITQTAPLRLLRLYHSLAITKLWNFSTHFFLPRQCDRPPSIRQKLIDLNDNSFLKNKCTPRVHSRLSTKNCQWDVKDTWSRLCLVGLQNVNPQKWVFKKVKVQPRVSKCNWRGTKNIAYISTYNKTKTDAGWRCCLCLLLCTGVQNKTTNFWPRCQNFKILPRLFWKSPRPQVCSEN